MQILPQAKAVYLNINPEYFFTLYTISSVSHYSFSLFSFDSITGSAIANDSTTVPTSNEKESVILENSDGDKDEGSNEINDDEISASTSGSSTSSSKDEASDDDKILKAFFYCMLVSRISCIKYASSAYFFPGLKKVFL